MPKDVSEIDVAIVGGGILGLWSAYSILKKHPHYSVVIFEAESYLGEHTTGRNSEVLHSGLYYPTNSLKHKHCLAGNVLWREYVKSKNLPFLDCGKIIVATKGQVEDLYKLRKKCVENEVKGVRELTIEEKKALEKILNIENGFFIGSSGVLNVSESLKALSADVERLGGIILRNSKIAITAYCNEKFTLSTNGDEIIANNLVNTAGLYTIDLREQLGLGNFSNYFVKGNYLTLKKKLNCDKLIYPIPPSHGLGLGVHLTLDTANGQKFGPNTELVKQIDYSIKDTLFAEMVPSIHAIFKTVNADDLQLGYCGIRPKIKKDGVLITDFIFNTKNEHGIKNYFEFLGIESPGLTSAPSLARMLAELI